MAIRILYFACFALLVSATLALYQTSERTRTVTFALARAERDIASEQIKRGALQANYERLARPDRVQRVAEEELGMTDSATVQLASLSMLPRRGEEDRIRQASAQTGQARAMPVSAIDAR